MANVCIRTAFKSLYIYIQVISIHTVSNTCKNSTCTIYHVWLQSQNPGCSTSHSCGQCLSQCTCASLNPSSYIYGTCTGYACTYKYVINLQINCPFYACIKMLPECMQDRFYIKKKYLHDLFMWKLIWVNIHVSTCM